jgi:uncharacterized repeat protein (TIGR02543 family)
MAHKRLFKLTITIAALALISALVLAGCSNPSGGGGNTSKQEGYKTYTAYDTAGNAFILVVTETDTYVLSIQGANGSTLGTSTGTVQSKNNTSYGLRHKNGSSFTVYITIEIIVRIDIPVPLDNGGTKSPEGNLSPIKPGVPNPSPGTTSYTVTFDANGGSGTPPASQTVKAGSSITLPGGSGLSKSGYTFDGWSEDSSGHVWMEAGYSYTPTEDVVLYAKWKGASGGEWGTTLSGTYWYLWENTIYYYVSFDGNRFSHGSKVIGGSSYEDRSGTYTVSGNRVECTSSVSYLFAFDYEIVDSDTLWSLDQLGHRFAQYRKGAGPGSSTADSTLVLPEGYAWVKDTGTTAMTFNNGVRRMFMKGPSGWSMGLSEGSASYTTSGGVLTIGSGWNAIEYPYSVSGDTLIIGESSAGSGGLTGNYTKGYDPVFGAYR